MDDATDSGGWSTSGENQVSPTEGDLPPSRNEKLVLPPDESGTMPLQSRLEAQALSKNKKPQDVDDSDQATAMKNLPAHKNNQKEERKQPPPPTGHPNVYLPSERNERKLVLHIVKSLMVQCQSENGFDWDFGDGVRFIWLVKTVYSNDPRGYLLFLRLIARNTVASLAKTVEDIKILFRYNTALYIQFDKLLPPSLRMDPVSRAMAEVDAQMQSSVARDAILRRSAMEERKQAASSQAQASDLTVQDAMSLADALTHVMSPEEYGEVVCTLEEVRDARITIDEAVIRLTPIFKRYPGLTPIVAHIYQKIESRSAKR